MAIFQYGYRMVCAIMWKSWRVRKRHWVRTCLEIAAPVLLVLLLVSVKAVMEPDELSEDTSKPINFISHDLKYLIRQICQINCGTTNLFRSVLAYAPNDDKIHSFVIKLMNNVQSLLVKNAAEIDVQGFESEAEIEAFNAMIAMNNGSDPTPIIPIKTKLVGAIVFVNAPRKEDSKTGELVYKLRLVDQKFITGKTFADMEFPGPGKHFKIYENSGFLGLQLAVDLSYIELLYGKDTGYEIETQAMAYPPYQFQEKTHFTMVLSMLLPAAIIIGFCYIVTTTITEIVREKEAGVRLFLNMLGLNQVGYWLGWMLNFGIPATASVLLIVMVLTVNVTGTGPVLVYSSVPVLTFFLMTYIFASVWFCFFIATFFNSSGFANSLGVLAWMASFVVPALLIGSKQRFLGSQLLASIFPNMCLFWGFHTIANWEARVVGLHWDNMWDYPSSVESLNMALIVIELIFDGFFYMILTMFMRRDMYNSSHLKNPFRLLYDALYDDTRFPECIQCFRRGLCCCRRKKPATVQKVLGVDINEYSALGVLRTKILGTAGLVGTPLFNALRFDTQLFEKEVLNKNAGIKVRNVSKSYKGETVIKSLSCDFYKNEITVLLGPNGAGKTTLMNILTGMMDAEDGTVWVNRYDIRDYKTEARRSIGLCPQTNMLFDELTVMEHLMLFSWLRGGQWHNARHESVQLISQLNLKDAAKTQAMNLSGGQKRKLCFAIAVTGNPQVILLDEATAGLDSESRRAVWNILQKLRENRTILLTTHSMEEADVLADRIAIMSEGTLKSFGTPQFLKKVHGSGYTIKFRVEGNLAEKLLRVITAIIPTAEVKSRELCVGGEDISFMVPAGYSRAFPDLFGQLYDRQEYLGILSIDVHHTSMEEVFLGVKEVAEFETNGVRERKAAAAAAANGKQDFIAPRKIGSIVKLSFARFNVLLRKQIWLTQANTVIFICQYLLPLALVLSGVAGANRGFRNRDLDHYSENKMTLEDYNGPISVYNTPNVLFGKSYESVVGRGARSTKTIDVQKVVSEIGKMSEKDYRDKYVVGMEEDDFTITVLYNTIPYHSPPLAVNLVTNALLKYLLPKRNLPITVENHPMQTASKETLDSISEEGVTAVVKSFCFYFSYALAVVCAFIALRPLKEKACGSQHLQLMSGTHPLSFWLSYLVVDGAYILTLSGLVLLVVWVTQESTLYTMHDGALVLFLIFSLGCFATASFAYFVIHILKNPGSSFGWFNMFHLSAAFASFIIYQTHPKMEDTVSVLFYWVSVFFPVPFVVHALHSFAKIAIYNARCAVVALHVLDSICDKNGSYVYLPAYGCCANCTGDNCFKPMSYFSKSFGKSGYTICWDLATLAFVGMVYLILIILIDVGYFQKFDRCCLAAPSEAFEDDEATDESAMKEAEKVRKLIGLGENVPKTTGLLVDGISKNFGSTAAVANVSFATHSGDCFGVLGVNGAGKTTILQILSGAAIPAIGDVYLIPNSLLGDRTDYLAQLGYCPQRSSLLEDLTGRQLVYLYGALRGISKEYLTKECQYWLSALGLEQDADRPCKDYSGGMQRRLCVASALIGDPRVIMLDEPTSGVDPGGKRHLWNTLQRLQRNGKIVLLASHNVQECEILCRKIGLMVAGRMRYVDSTQAVQKMFLNGFTVVFRFRTKHYGSDNGGGVESVFPVNDLRQEIETILGECILREAHHNMVRYLLPQRGQNWGELFQKLELVRTSMEENIDSYSLTGSSLDEVFQAMADMDADASNILPKHRITCLQQCLMGKCCTDDYA